MPITVHPRTQQTIEELRGRIALLKTQKKALMTQKKKLQKEKKALQAQNTELKKTNHDEQLEEQVGNFGTEASRAWEDRMRLTDRLNDAETQLATTKEELASSKQREGELKEQLDFERSLRE
jgi:hypothetical protein